MAYIPTPLPQAAVPGLRPLGLAIALGAAVAIACAFGLGLVVGMTNTQYAYGAILLGVFTGQAVRRIRRDTQAAVTAGLLSLAGSALASLIAITVGIVRTAHLPLALVLAHMPTVISLLPHVITTFGYLCWALATFTGFVNVGGLRPGRRARGQTIAAGQGQPGGPPGLPPDPSGSGFVAPPGQAGGPGPGQMPGG
jgi:hypothetical protein